MTVVWGIVGMLVGVIVAAQLAFPDFFLWDGIQWLSYGRLRPLHTNAVIFAFGGCALFATSYYVVQAPADAAVAGPLASFTFWGWQLIIVLAAVTLPLGITTSKEYAELEWPIDLLIGRGVGGLRHRVLRHAGDAQGVSHLRRQLVLRCVHPDRRAAPHRQQHGDPVTLTKSYSLYHGAIDAMVQWWYGHNAVRASS